MEWAVPSLAMALAAEADAPPAAAAQPVTYEAAFVPPLKSEGRYAPLGPAGPFYPQNATRPDGRWLDVTFGEAVLECRVTAAGALERCRILSDPPRHDFGVAAKVMAARRRIFVDGAPSIGQVIRVHLPFTTTTLAKVAP